MKEFLAATTTTYARTVAAIDEAIAAYGESEPVSFPGTAYSLPCYYGVTGVKITTLGEMKAAMDTIKSKMTRNNRLHDAFDSRHCIRSVRRVYRSAEVPARRGRPMTSRKWAT